MAKRVEPLPLSPAAPRSPKGAASIRNSSFLRLPTRGNHEALREVAFRERLTIHDIILEGIETALRNRGRRK